MAIRTILHYPDPRLRRKAKPVTQFDDALRALVADMIETAIHDNGMGLAAPQINVSQQVIIMNFSHALQSPFAVINPRLIAASGEDCREEYCLSILEIGVPVKRATDITVAYFDEWGKPHEITATGIQARCFQHEMDHLAGRLTVDYLSPLKRNMYLKKIQKLIKQHKKASA